jgi:hypothetical protein
VKHARKEPTLRDKLAAALRELLQIPYEHAKLMSPEQIESLVEWHHIHYHADGHGVEHWNLDPLPRAGHKARTAKIDIPQIAKTKRISKAQEEFRTRLLTPRDERPAKKSKWGSRPFNRRRTS